MVAQSVGFALSGFKTGFGLFRKNGRVEASTENSSVDQSSAEVSGSVELESEVAETHAAAAEIEMIAAGFEEPQELKEPEEETALKETSPQSESTEAEVKQELENALVSAESPAAVPAAEGEASLDAQEQVPVEPIAEKASSEQATAEVTEQLEEVEQPAEPALPVEAMEEESQPAEETAPPAVTPEEEPKDSQAAYAAEPAEGAATSAPEIRPAPAAVPETLPELPPDNKPAERTTAEKVAAALKARGENAEQSPFSVLVGEVYDGPLDLLLDLIRKQDIDIYDIPIAKITAQFLAYVEHLRASDMDVAGEFIYTAALLIHIKSKMLLPRAPAGPDEADEDPRRELVERLLEHERFKNAAQMLHDRQMLEAATWTNPGVREFREEANAEPEIAADTTDLVRIFRDILDRARNRPIINVEEDTVTVGQMIQFLTRRLTMEDKPVALRRLLSHTHSETGADRDVSGAAGAGAVAGHPAAAGPALQRDLHQETCRF